METRRIQTEAAPAAVGPYSQAICVGNMVYTAGQIPLDPASGSVIEGDIEAQTARVLDNLSAVLEAAGSSLNQVVKTTVFLQDLGDFAAMNGVYAQYFDAVKPARSTVEVAALPLGAEVEVEAWALRR